MLDLLVALLLAVVVSAAAVLFVAMIALGVVIFFAPMFLVFIALPIFLASRAHRAVSAR